MRQAVNILCTKLVKPEFSLKMMAFMDVDTMAERLQGKKSISMEYIGHTTGWSRALLVAADEVAGKPRHAFFAVRTIHDEKAMEAARNKALEDVKEQAELAKRDALTGALNRAGYDEIMASLRGKREMLALLVVDVDHFKYVNDHYGHAVGDVALKKVAELLRVCFRAQDYVVRYGGDEFVVIIMGMTRKFAPVL